MLPPLPRCSNWVSSSLISPSCISLPRFHCRVGLHIVLFEDCSAFTHVAACTLAQSPYIVTAIRGLQTFRHLHACPGCFRRERSPGGPCTHLSGALVSSGNFQHRGLHFCGSCDGVGMINGSFVIAANSGKCAGRPRFCDCGKDRINLSPVRSFGTVTIIPHSAGRETGRWDQSGKAAMSQVGARSHTDPGAGVPRRPRFGRSLMMRRS